MQMASFAFLLGVWCLQQQSSLPALDPYVAMLLNVLLGGVATTVFAVRCKAVGGALHLLSALGMTAILAAGFLYAAACAQNRLSDALRGDLEGVDIRLTGVVSDLPQILGEGVRFVFQVERVEAPDLDASAVPQRILLSWYRARGTDAPLPVVTPGERWQFVVRLKRPHGGAVPGGFDYEAWLLEHNLRATGYVRDKAGATRIEEDVGGFMHAVHRLRSEIRQSFKAVLPEAPYTGVLIALAVGDQKAIGSEQWEIFRRTGVSHLVAISGLHVSLVALIAGGLCAMVWRRRPALVLRVPVRKAAAVAGLLAAAGYALLAGLGIPVQRALIMLGVLALAMLAGRETKPGQVLALALLCVLVMDPWAVLSAGFWLSFGAVGIILFVVGGRVGEMPGWLAAVRIQLAITLATIPALLLLFQSFSLVSPLANAVAIPLVSFVITPLALAAIAWPDAWLLVPAHGVVTLMMAWLEWLAGSGLALWQRPAPPAWMVICASAAVLVLLLPRATPGKLAAVCMIACLLLWQVPRPAVGAFQATVLDVGQGLAVHVQTAAHDLLFDTGPPYGATTDAGERVLVPYLGARGVSRIDRLILSHDDVDHVGGTRSVLAAVSTDHILAGEHVLTLRGLEQWPAAPCLADVAWEWDAVRFEVLAPSTELPGARRSNDLSCVLRIRAEGGSLLLVGDIEARTEAFLVNGHGSGLTSTAIVVAHHGSRSSSTADFVDAVMPQAAVFSVGHRNPFGHPHPVIWARWAEAGARNWRTDSQGSISLNFATDGLVVESDREQRPRYWHGR
ncbi:MAG: DNA internalization-related competence protein ComEC/Rec2 [Betaproteobacteria bacterium HGW-Betaproteobacteria-19]|nr:MAG: DNA internalization-related competence protein ComEC/Rec2 [Betaproteobacteria bacterium HGW-Betaproteobacteria-19]